MRKKRRIKISSGFFYDGKPQNTQFIQFILFIINAVIVFHLLKLNEKSTH